MDYEALDGAQMVLVGESDYGETLIITWHGQIATLQLHDDTLQVYETRSYDTAIKDSAHARRLAKLWLADLIVASEIAQERMHEDDGA